MSTEASRSGWIVVSTGVIGEPAIQLDPYAPHDQRGCLVVFVQAHKSACERVACVTCDEWIDEAAACCCICREAFPGRPSSGRGGRSEIPVSAFGVEYPSWREYEAYGKVPENRHVRTIQETLMGVKRE